VSTMSSTMEHALDSQVPEKDNNITPQKEVVTAARTKEPFWDDTPAAWVGREADWSQLSLLLLSDVNTFLIPPTRVVPPPTEPWTDLELTPEIVAQCVAAVAVCPPLHQVRFDLVPKWTNEQLFWSNLHWRLREFGKCDGTVSTVAELLKRTNTESAESTHRKKNTGVTDNKAMLEEIGKRYQQWVSIRSKCESLSTAAKEDMRSCRDNIRLLTSLDDRSDGELRESIFQSCRYQKKKLATRIAEASSALTELMTTCVADVPTHGVEAVRGQCEETLTELHSVNETILGLLKTESMRVVPADLNTSNGDVDGSPPRLWQSPASHNDLPKGPAKERSPPLAPVLPNEKKSSTHKTPSLDNEYFEAKLPWEQ